MSSGGMRPSRYAPVEAPRSGRAGEGALGATGAAHHAGALQHCDRQARRASSAAATSPLWPAPMTTTSDTVRLLPPGRHSALGAGQADVRRHR